ncbi:tRNA (adenosine(37)-N6)-threonylcarbamoyltransferase complex ATPase subunit type 1 TsaE [Acuticoccus kandeliae]|uniref:tRNA (adenosine(37)-N6)-threonylcarbamoyltransferase complex ATPase subunit type 1 TsaE n=1 Tax=Acuticoccus kandeliae TaxID=2073160 RepID=UPI000D3E72D7|nr:tRNA (adenosine(37)-N6)-threonylcarbamoyltransferase complex ATPase subunit type 1 TsaE [Acuticoccus kandeliae]
MSTVRIDIRDEAAMAALGGSIARVLRPGDRVALVGDLGAGKTTLSRAILRAIAEDPALEVPSPTFTLVQDYDLRLAVRHVDLYRVSGDDELVELGLGEGDAVELVEWPREAMPITVEIGFGDADEARRVTIEAPSTFTDALARQDVLAAFLDKAGWGAAERTVLKADASTRRYERLFRGEERAVLMDAPSFVPPPDSYPVRARLADGNMGAFLAVGALLAARGLTVPRTLAVDAEAGCLLQEDLGDEKIAVDGVMVAERYRAAADAIAAFHQAPPPAILPGPPAYTPPRFDADLAAVEVALFPEWYLRAPIDPEFAALWRAAIEGIGHADDHLALRDVHSPNLLWLPEREGVHKIGWIDYQDALFAPSVYDVVSLTQDARVDVPDEIEAELVARYLAARPGLDVTAWRRAYHIVGAERATRILGVFRRLNDRDGKPQYLAHLPRLKRQLAKNLRAEPALEPLKAWFARHTTILSEVS